MSPTETPEGPTSVLSRPTTRREAISRGSVLVGGAMVVAACGGSSSQSASHTTTKTAGVKKGGHLLAGITAGTNKDVFNPFYAPTLIDHAREEQIFEGFANIAPNGSREYLAATAIEPNSTADVWTLQIRPGIEFHNGKTATAQDALYTFQYALNPKNLAQVLPQLQQIDLTRTKTLDKYTLRIQLKAPNSVFGDQIGTGMYNNIALIPEGFDQSAPVGTGPFKLVSFTPGEQAVFERFPNYWGAPLPHLDMITILDIADPTAKVNALVAGQVHCIDTVPTGSIPVIQGNGDLALLKSKTAGLRALHMNCNISPFTDVRVREAMKLAVDREQLVAQALSGYGQVAYDISSIYLDPAYPYGYTKPRDVEKAASLFKAAGLGHVPITLTEADVASGLLAAAELIPAQVKEAGINVTFHEVDSTTLYGPQYTHWQLEGDWWGAKPYLLQVQQGLLPTSTYNLTHWNDPQFFSLYGQALKTVDPTTHNEIVREMMMLDSEQGGMLVWAFPDQLDGYSTKIAGLPTSVGGFPLGFFRFKDVYFT
jgi:peptide/nickel transport system substrate-binding protein